MGRQYKNESLPEMVMAILEWVFQILPPWTSIPIGLIGFLVINLLWASTIKIPQFQIVGIVLGVGFALFSLIAGLKGVQFRRRQMAFLKADIDINWVRSLSWQNFEKQLASAYRQNGYQVEETGGGGPDGGIDLKLYKNGRYTVVQCKHWRTWKVNVSNMFKLSVFAYSIKSEIRFAIPI
jgi:restriction system protein